MDKKRCREIYRILKNGGLSDAGCFAVIGNLNAESALNPKNLQQNGNRELNLTDDMFTKKLEAGEYTMHQFIHDGYGYGLAQWTYYTRKHGLYFFAKTQGKNISDMELQCQYILKEIKGYGKLLSKLYEEHNLKELSDLVLTVYEKPADQSDKAKDKRYGYAVNAYNIIYPDSENESGNENKEMKFVVQRVIDGMYGNYPERKKALEAEGYNYREVQNMVNEELKRRKKKNGKTNG